MADTPQKRHGAPLGLWPEILRGLLRRWLRPFRVLWRRSFLYRGFLKGKLSDHIRFYPYDALPRRLEDADALLRGRFRFAGDIIEVKEGSIFEKEAPSPAWSRALHGFAWLPPLSAAGGEASRTLATNLITQWLRRNPRYSEPAFEAQTMARRLIHLFAHGRFVLANSDMLWRSKMFVSLREQSKLLARIADEAPPGLPRLEAAAALALSGACLDDSPKRLAAGLQRLEDEIAVQILPDGGHITRSPEALVHAYRHVMMVADALTAIDHPVPAAIRSAHDRMAPMLRFFRHGDGALALFNGGGESDPRMIAGMLARDEVRGQPFVHAPHSGYQRMASGKALFLMDCGAPPKGAFSSVAHAGTLAFEFSNGVHRIVVNCGGAPKDAGAQAKWDSALRTTAAHSTLTVSDTTIAPVLSTGLARDILGARLLGGAREVSTARGENLHGRTVEAAHDGYLKGYGLRHQRTVTLAAQGAGLTGADRLLPTHGKHQARPFAVRFHIHPDVRVSSSQGGDVLLKLPNGEGWRFRAGGGQMNVEESIYMGGDAVRRTEQIVVTGTVKDDPVEIAWTFEQMGA